MHSNRGAIDDEKLKQIKGGNVNHCIERPELADYLQGKLAEHRAEEIATHVDACDACQDTVVELAEAEDTFADGFRMPSDPVEDTVVKENAFKHGLQRLLSGLQRNPIQSTVNLPKQIGPYLIEEPLGSGGMGCVFRAQHSKLKRTVALKLLPANRWANSAAIARFEREMEAIGTLDHPHIVRASDAGEDNGMHYLVMEYVDGLDLGATVESTRTTSSCGSLRSGSASSDRLTTRARQRARSSRREAFEFDAGLGEVGWHERKREASIEDSGSRLSAARSGSDARAKKT